MSRYRDIIKFRKSFDLVTNWVHYPIAGFLGTKVPEKDFLYGGMLTLSLLLIVFLFLRPRKKPKISNQYKLKA